MESKVAMMNIVVNDISAIDDINSILHEYRDSVIGRMGLPYRPKPMDIIISIALDAPQGVISELSDRIKDIEGVSVKTAFTK